MTHSLGRIHENCRIKFKTRINRYRKKYRDSIIEESGLSSNGDDKCHMVTNEIRKSNRRKIAKELCFICEEKRSVDNNSYNEGGVARCETDSVVEKLHTRTNMYIADRKHKFYDAAHRFQILGSGHSFDDFATDICYHKSCYISYAIKQHTTDTMGKTKK